MFRIKEIIREQNSSVKEIAAIMGISQPALSSIINGNPTTEKLKAVAEALGVPISELFVDGKKNDGVALVCPHCRKNIKVDIKFDVE